ncbi:MAG TPA: molybdate ABC transporter substrate-binding protein [Stellaceae bacterium]|nr:molybdate ABC transporter substrate-binding protein [Stellaceae bacterium]
MSSFAYRPINRRTLLANAASAFALAVSPAIAAAGDLVVFAAASLKTALDAIAAEWWRDSGKRAVISYAASSALARQIENGAPASLFISADLKWMDYLQQRQLIDGQTRVDLLGNMLVLVAPQKSPVQATIAPGFPLAALIGDRHLAMAEPNSVPAGIYGKAALSQLGVWPAVERRVAAAENVRAALALVARGEAPLGIVYRTDAAAEPAVRIVATFPAGSHPPIVYPMALTKDAPPEAAAFAAYLRRPDARQLFEAQGFTMLDAAR